MSPVNPDSICLEDFRFCRERAYKGKRILIIDDETELLKTLGARLLYSGYAVEVANSGKKGIKQAKELKPDLIILDVIMPDMDGPQVAAALKSHPETRRVPILFLSCLLNNWSDGNNVPVFRDSSYMGKPYRPEQLLEQIETMIG